MKYSKLISIIVILVFLLLIIDIFRDDIKNILNIRATSVSTTISVYVDPDTPVIYIASPLNKTYNYNTSIELNFTVIDSTLDKIYYNIDNGTNITITANTTFSVTSNQSHKLTLFANDTTGRLNSTSVTFSINLSKGHEISFNDFNEGETTNFSSINKTLLQNLSNVILHKIDRGKIKFIDSLNISREINISKYVNISFNRIEIDSVNLLEFNKSAILEISNLTFTNPRILFNGITCPASICTKNSYSSGLLSFNITHFTTFSTEETPSSGSSGSSGGSAGSGGGGGGGSKKTEIILDDFRINRDLIKISLLQGETKIEFIDIENTGNRALDFTLDLENLKDFLIFPGGVSKYSFKLYSGEKQSLQLIFNTPKDYKPGIYPGKIIVKSDKLERIITTIVEIESSKKIFDIDIRLSNKKVVKGHSLITEINIFNLGLTQERIDADVEVGIKDLKGNIITKKTNRIAVQTQASFVEDLLIPEYLEEGRYVVYASVKSNGEVGTVSEIFEVTEKEAPGGFLPISSLILYTIPGLISIVVILIILKFKKHKRHKH